MKASDGLSGSVNFMSASKKPLKMKSSVALRLALV